MEAHQDDMEVKEPVACSILDVLNADCWREVFDYLTINDVLRSERVSRAWQGVVLDYLTGVHFYQVSDEWFERHDNCLRLRWGRHVKDKTDHKIITSNKSCNRMIQKMGPFIEKLVITSIQIETGWWLNAIAINCPNLESLEVNQYNSCHVTICYRRKPPVAVVPIDGNRFRNLKTLALRGCNNDEIRFLKSNVEYLTGLTRLEVNDFSETVADFDFLNGTPNLEHLSLFSFYYANDGTDSDTFDLPAAIGRLGRLKTLELMRNWLVTDEWLAAAARGCPELRTVNVGYCQGVTASGVLALCRARPALVELVVAGTGVTDDDLEAYARCCGGLELLDAMECDKLTPRLPARLAWARERPLLVQVYGTAVEKTRVQYKGLKLSRKPIFYN